MTTYELGACPACASTRQTVIATLDDVKDEVEQLWQFQLERRHEDIPTDQLFDRAFFSQNPPLQIVSCDGCGTVFRNPWEASERLVELYAREEPEREVYEQLFDAQCSSYGAQAAVLTE